MQSMLVGPALRVVTRPVAAQAFSRHTIRRNFASEKPGDVGNVDSTRSVSANPAGGSSRLPFVILGGVLFLMVAGRYILASDKPARSGQAEQIALRREGKVVDNTRDPRDSPVKTLEQKRQRDGSS